MSSAPGSATVPGTSEPLMLLPMEFRLDNCTTELQTKQTEYHTTSYVALSKLMILCLAKFVTTLDCLQSSDHGLDMSA